MKGRTKGEVRIGDRVVHPYRALVPDIEPDRYADLLDRLRRNPKLANKYPVQTDAAGRIVDGRAMLRACLDLNLQAQFEVVDRTDLAQFTVDTMNRASYSDAALAVVAASLLVQLTAEARKRQRDGTKVGEKFPKGRAAQQAVDAVGGSNYKDVARVAQLLKTNGDVVERVRARKIEKVTHFYRVAALEGEHRAEVLRRLDDGEEPALALRDARSQDDLWLTPKYIADAIRALFGGEIACDPCAPAKGIEQFVNARVQYTEADNGLKRPWLDGTYVNPPFSDVAPWIAKAIEEAAKGKHIYMLLPVRPDTEHQAAALNAAVDYLLLEGRVAFGKPKSKTTTTGRNPIMIVGFNCSTRPLVEAGIRGRVSSVDPPRDELRIEYPANADGEIRFILEPRQYAAHDVGDYEHPDPTPKERRDAEALLQAQLTEHDDRVAAARRAVSDARPTNSSRTPGV